MKLGAAPQYSLYAAAYNRDTDAIRLLVRYGADIEEPSGPARRRFSGRSAGVTSKLQRRCSRVAPTSMRRTIEA